MSNVDSSEQTMKLRCTARDCHWEPEQEYLNRNLALRDARLHVTHTHHVVEVLTVVNYYWQEEIQ